MITIKKTYGVQGAANDITLVKIQELIAIYKEDNPVGKAVIDTEKITFYKFGLKVGLARFATNGLVVNEQGIIRYDGLMTPIIWNKQILLEVYRLFDKRCIC